jgi:hypothetical protein
MDKGFKQFFKEARKIKLDQEQKAQIRERLYQFMESNPLPEIPKIPMTALFRRYALAITVLIIILGSTGLSFIAEGSTPGGFFYPVKHFNEKIADSFMLTEEAEIRWEMRKTERRLEEAEKLAARENLKAKHIAYLEGDFEKRAQMVNSKIAEFELRNKITDAAKFSSHFETSLRAHDQILTKIIKSKSVPENEVEPLILNVRAKTNLASRVRAKTEDAVLSDSPMGGGAPMMLAAQGEPGSSPSELDLAVQERLTDVTNMIERVEDILKEKELSDETIKATQEKLDWAKELIRQGEDHLEDGVISKSFLLAQKAHRIVQEIEILIEGHLNLFDGVDIKRGTISIKDCDYPVAESFPRQCITPDGGLVIEEDLEIEIPR